MKWIGYRINGELGRFFYPMTNERFEKISKPLPQGYVVWHEGTADFNEVRKRPIIVETSYWNSKTYPNDIKIDPQNWSLVPAKKMPKKDIAAFVKETMSDKGWFPLNGHGTVVRIDRNGVKFSYGSLTEAKKHFQEGDKVEVDIYTNKGGYHKADVHFQIVKDEKLIKDSRNLKGYSTYKEYDPQRKKLYAFERSHVKPVADKNEMSYEEIVELSKEVCNTFGIEKTPEVLIRGQLKRWSWCTGWSIELAKGWGVSVNLQFYMSLLIGLLIKQLTKILITQVMVDNLYILVIYSTLYGWILTWTI